MRKAIISNLYNQNRLNNMNEIRKIVKEGIILDQRECRPLLLSSDSVYFIESGSVNLFYSSVNDTTSTGSRTYIASYDTNDLLFSIPGISCDSKDFCLIAYPLPNSRIYKLKQPLADLLVDNDLSSCVLEKLYHWINKLSLSLIIEGKPPFLCRVVSNQEIESNKGSFSLYEKTIFKTEHELIWISLKKGICYICNNQNYVIQEGDIFPLHRDLWLNCKDEVSIEFQSTENIIRDTNFFLYLKKFYEHFFRALNFSIKHNKNAALEKRKSLAKLESNAVEKSEEELISLGAKIEKNIIRLSSELLLSPCIASMKILGKSLNISFKFPETIPAHLSEDKLLCYLLEYSSVFYRKVTLQEEWWKSETINMIVFYKNNNLPTALIYNKRKGYLLYNFNKNTCLPINKNDILSLKSYGYAVYPQFSSKKITIKDIIRLAFMGLKWEFLIVLAAGLFTGLISLIQPYVTGIIFNSIIPLADYFQLYQIGVILTTAAITSIIFSAGNSLLFLRVRTFSEYYLQSALIGRMLKLPTTFFKNFSSGDLTQRVMGIATIRKVLADNVTTALFSLIFISPNLVFMFYYSWQLSLIGVGFVLLFFLVLAVIGVISCKNAKNQIQIEGELSGFMIQLLNGINKIRHSISENRVFIKWVSRFAEENRWGIRSMNNNRFLSVFNSFYVVLITCLFFYLVGSQWRSSFNVGTYLAFNSAFTAFMEAMIGFSGVISSVVTVVPLYKRLKPVLDATPESDSNLKIPEELDGSLELNHISYRYDEESALVLRDINIVVPPGKFIAIVGPSGAGKSTIIRLLLGFEKPESGCIFYSRQDISTINCRELRKQIGTVLQSGALISGSIYENIAGASELSIEDAWRAAAMAGCEKDIQDMPMGMHTIVGDSTLSGGQRQRILIARALSKRPKIIIFDEATSALDNETQAQVADSLKKLNVTRVIVAHRLSTIEHADNIYVLDKGQIVQQGTYKELINKVGLFNTLAKRQMV